MGDVITVQDIAGFYTYSNALGDVYRSISSIHENLRSGHDAIRQNWIDERVEAFSENFDTASEYMWQLQVAISNMQEFLSSAADTYSAAERQVSSL